MKLGMKCIRKYSQQGGEGHPQEARLAELGIKVKGKKIMKIRFSRFFAFLSLLFVFSYSNVLAGNQLTEQQAQDILMERIQKDKPYSSWTTLSCLQFLLEEKTKDYFDFAIREKHSEKCPGDPNTSPIVDRFRVNRLTKKIQWYEPVEGDFLPYNTVLKVKLQKKEKP
jgi:hypothetical protein